MTHTSTLIGAYYSGSAQLLAAAETLADAREWERACALLAGAGETTEVLAKRAFFLSRAERFGEARELLEQLHARDPQNFQWVHMIGYQHLQEKGIRSGGPVVPKGIRSEPSTPEEPLPPWAGAPPTGRDHSREALCDGGPEALACST